MKLEANKASPVRRNAVAVRSMAATPRQSSTAFVPAPAAKGACVCGGGCPRCRKKSMRPVSQPGDVYEREADHIADRVLGMPVPASVPKVRPVQQKILQPQTTAAASMRAAPAPAAGGGESLDAGTRAFFEPRLDADLAGVRVHHDGRAAAANRALNARAFTIGNDIWFGAGEYAPGSSAGRRLIAHELVHTLQQRVLTPRVQRTPVVTNCEAPATTNILRAHTEARAWLTHAVSRLARPQEIAAELAYHFRTDASDTRTVGQIRDELNAVKNALGSELISYNCAHAGHPDCEGDFLLGFAFLDSYDASFCDPLPQNYSTALVSTLIHEAIHALAPGIPDGPYISDPDYPGEFPLSNTDAYSQLVQNLATDIVTGVASETVDESVGFLPDQGGYTSSLGRWGVETNLHGFPVDDATLTAEAQRYLEYLLEDWADNIDTEDVVLRLASHTDGSSARERDARLGHYRAEVVRDYLLAQLRRWSLTAPLETVIVDFGASRPYTASRTARGRALNRRVQIEVHRLSARRTSAAGD